MVEISLVNAQSSAGDACCKSSLRRPPGIGPHGPVASSTGRQSITITARRARQAFDPNRLRNHVAGSKVRMVIASPFACAPRLHTRGRRPVARALPHASKCEQTKRKKDGDGRRKMEELSGTVEVLAIVVDRIPWGGPDAPRHGRFRPQRGHPVRIRLPSTAGGCLWEATSQP